MKKILLSLGIATAIITSCDKGKNNNPVDNTEATQQEELSTKDSTQVKEEPKADPVDLPTLAKGEEVVFENSDVRIVSKSTETSTDSYNTFKIQPKTTAYKKFEIRGTYLSFQKIIGNTLVVTEGTGVISDLLLYDLKTGQKPMEVQYSITDEVKVENDDEFSYYTINENSPSMFWNGETSSWEKVNNIPQKLMNDDLAKAQKKVEEFGGGNVSAYQKIRVNLKDKKVTPLEEYKWDYAE